MYQTITKSNLSLSYHSYPHHSFSSILILYYVLDLFPLSSLIPYNSSYLHHVKLMLSLYVPYLLSIHIHLLPIHMDYLLYVILLSPFLLYHLIHLSLTYIILHITLSLLHASSSLLLTRPIPNLLLCKISTSFLHTLSTIILHTRL